MFIALSNREYGRGKSTKCKIQFKLSLCAAICKSFFMVCKMVCILNMKKYLICDLESNG